MHDEINFKSQALIYLNTGVKKSGYSPNIIVTMLWVFQDKMIFLICAWCVYKKRRIIYITIIFKGPQHLYFNTAVMWPYEMLLLLIFILTTKLMSSIIFWRIYIYEMQNPENSTVFFYAASAASRGREVACMQGSFTFIFK